MALLVQLISDKLGAIVINHGAPNGLNNLKQVLKRDSLGEGIIKTTSVELGFILDSKAFLQSCVAVGGPDTNVICNIFEYTQETKLFDYLYFSGKINFNTADISEDIFNVHIDESGFQRRVLNSYSKSLNALTAKSILGSAIVPPTPVTLRLHSKKILYQYSGNGSDPDGFGDTGVTVPTGQYLSIDPTQVTRSEIKTKNNIGIQLSSTIPNPLWNMDENGDYTFDIYVEINHASGTDYDLVNVFYKINDNAPVALTRVDLTAFRTTFTLSATIAMFKGGSFRLYFKNEAVNDVFVFITSFVSGVNPLVIDVSNLSNTADSSTSALFMRDAIKQCIKFATGVEDCFKSELLSRVETDGVDGDAALDTITTGNLIRNRDKEIFINLKTLSETVSNIYCASTGFETDENNVERFIVEKLEYFYNKDLYSVNLGKIAGVVKTMNYERLFNNFVFGYSTAIDIQQVNAVDGFNTLRTYILGLINSVNTKPIDVDLITDGYLIEYERRLIGATSDGKHDDKLFLIKAFRDSGFRAAKDDGYTSITGVVDSESGYNYDLSPGRILQNWKKYLAANLIYAENKNVQFSSGTVNYEMVTTKVGELPVYENGDLDLTDIEPFTTPWDLTFTCKTTSEQFRLIKQYPYRYILFQTLESSNMQGFISKEGITHEPNAGTCEYTLMEVFRPQ